ncbi:DUF29 domain-containing protein [Candidatus Entotheonella palauensis]|uniref:DUF29 domain-containing protein n=1 Tax=Candidatus Entotheonella gemina TaxID=1429439 RepID=W4M1F0_9BACT|nr:DUF29 domain-containing protein [Candidatus Entotheonella palauensis]ETX03958.1 MAG: hypothetical protein ETSY2_31575 [Candidatus Entotheonella gemina]
MDWEALATTSHYNTAVAIRDALREGNVDDASVGLEELIDALSRSEKRALRSHLVRLMQYIIKWKVQPDRRSPSWMWTIRNARIEIADVQEETPSLTDRVIAEELWERCLRLAHNEAAKDMELTHLQPQTLTWEEVFDAPYTLDAP